jgi:hypothetical protein
VGTPVTVVVGELGLVIVAVPPNKLQLPIPFTGVLADMIKVPLLHCSICAGPAFAPVGVAELVKTISSTLTVHVPLLIRHSNVALLPTGTPVMVLVSDPGVLIVAVPEVKNHWPVPTTAGLAAIVKSPSLQLFRSPPAEEVVGKA